MRRNGILGFNESSLLRVAMEYSDTLCSQVASVEEIRWKVTGFAGLAVLPHLPDWNCHVESVLLHKFTIASSGTERCTHHSCSV